MAGFHLFPFRTEKLSPPAPMVLHTRGRVGSRLFLERSPSREIPEGFFVCVGTQSPQLAQPSHSSQPIQPQPPPDLPRGGGEPRRGDGINRTPIELMRHIGPIGLMGHMSLRTNKTDRTNRTNETDRTNRTDETNRTNETDRSNRTNGINGLS